MSFKKLFRVSLANNSASSIILLLFISFPLFKYITMTIVFFLSRFGRKRCLLITILINSISGVLVAVVPSYTWVVVFRLIQGLVSKGGWLTGYILSKSVDSLNIQLILHNILLYIKHAPDPTLLH